MKNIIRLMCAILWCCISPAVYAASEASCPSEVLETNTVEAVYLGSEFLSPFLGFHSTFMLDNRVKFSLFDPLFEAGIFDIDASEKTPDVVLVNEKTFGAVGNRVSVTYDTIQEWNGMVGCRQLEVIRAGHILADSAPVDIPAEVSAAAAAAADLPATYINSLGMEFVLIPAGTFMMGSEIKEKPVHQVTISQPFYMGKYEVTQGQWEAMMGAVPQKKYYGQEVNYGPNYPVEAVSWEDTRIFIQKLNQKEGGEKYRLPTEAEWEYAARAGSDTEWFFGNDYLGLPRYAWIEGNSKGGTHPVGEKEPNPWGLYDIYGNASEMVKDKFAPYRPEAVTDPAGPGEGQADIRILRGGDYNCIIGGQLCRSAGRYPVDLEYAPDEGLRGAGFRLVFFPGASVEVPGDFTAKVEAPEARAQAAKTAAGLDNDFINNIGMEFVLIPAGQFTNRFPAAKGGEGKRLVTISRPFYLGKHEVTREQWAAVMGANSKTSGINGGGRYPVDNVSWNEAQDFIGKLNEKTSGGRYRLPTEAEWEYASRAGTPEYALRSGTNIGWFFGNKPEYLAEYAWFKENSQGSTHPVGEKKPNPWGLYDMYGNVAEWVQDRLGAGGEGSWFSPGEVTDPTGVANGSRRVFRGGSFVASAQNCRSDTRDGFLPDFKVGGIGFRLAFIPEQ